jgi:2,3-bisphosphoglycerate-independent phosphoglycerate mutase
MAAYQPRPSMSTMLFAFLSALACLYVAGRYVYEALGTTILCQAADVQLKAFFGEIEQTCMC